MVGCYCSECRSKREMPSMYPHAKGILHALKDKGIDVAVASRSPTPDIANTFLQKLSIDSIFVAKVSFSKILSLMLLIIGLCWRPSQIMFNFYDRVC